MVQYGATIVLGVEYRLEVNEPEYVKMPRAVCGIISNTAGHDSLYRVAILFSGFEWNVVWRRKRCFEKPFLIFLVRREQMSDTTNH